MMEYFVNNLTARPLACWLNQRIYAPFCGSPADWRDFCSSGTRGDGNKSADGGFSMKRVLQQVSLVAAGTFLAMVLAPCMHAQQADQDPSPPAPEKTNPAVPQVQQNEAHMPASGEATTRDAQTFTGRIVKEEGQIVLKDPVTKVSYKLDDAAKAKQYMGKRVKATGKLDLNTNTIQLDRIEPLS
jgi:Protein of unknown function (DUF5818)